MSRNVLIVGDEIAVKSRSAIMLAQGFNVVTISYIQAKKYRIPILKNKINVIDFKHLNQLTIKKIQYNN